MSNMFEGMTISFPNLMDVLIVRANDVIKRGTIDYYGHFEYSKSTKDRLEDFGIDGVVLKIHFVVNVAPGAKIPFDESTETSTTAADAAMSYISNLVCPSGWHMSDIFHVSPADALFPKSKVVENKRRDVVDTSTTNEIRLSARLDGGMNWVRLEDHERKIAELEAQLSKVTE